MEIESAAENDYSKYCRPEPDFEKIRKEGLDLMVGSLFI